MAQQVKRRIWVWRHLAFESLGLLENLFDEWGWQYDYLDVGVDDLTFAAPNSADALVILGGPIGVGDTTRFPYLALEKQQIQKWLEADKPVLGICLGAQLMASVLGADVKPMAEKEIGFGTIALTEAGQASCLAKLIPSTPVLHWHGDQFDIPASANGLASSALCPNQAFSVGKSLGLQFHLEADLDRIEQWLIGHIAELNQAGVELEVIRQQAKQVKQDLALSARDIFEAWFTEVSLLK